MTSEELPLAPSITPRPALNAASGGGNLLPDCKLSLETERNLPGGDATEVNAQRRAREELQVGMGEARGGPGLTPKHILDPVLRSSRASDGSLWPGQAKPRFQKRLHSPKPYADE